MKKMALPLLLCLLLAPTCLSDRGSKPPPLPRAAGQAEALKASLEQRLVEGESALWGPGKGPDKPLRIVPVSASEPVGVQE